MALKKIQLTSYLLTIILGSACTAQSDTPPTQPAPTAPAVVSAPVMATADPAANPLEWPNWRGPTHDGKSGVTGIKTAFANGELKRLWKKPLGTAWAGIAVAQGKVITMGQEGEKEVTVCFNAKTGDELWRHTASGHNKHFRGEGPNTTPAIVGDKVYTLGSAGGLACLNLADGKPVWEKDILKDGEEGPQYGIGSSPRIIEGQLVVQPGGKKSKTVLCVSAATGDTIWEALNEDVGYATTQVATLHGIRQYLVFTGKHALGMDPKTGTVLWQQPWRTQYNLNIPDLIAFGDNMVFLVSGYGTGCGLYQIDNKGSVLTSREIYKSGEFPSHFSTPILIDDHVYVATGQVSGGDGLKCMEIVTGTVKWTAPKADIGHSLLAEGHVFTFAQNGDLVAVQATPEKYIETGRDHILDGEDQWGAPALANGLMYVRSRTEIACLDMRKAQ